MRKHIELQHQWSVTYTLEPFTLNDAKQYVGTTIYVLVSNTSIPAEIIGIEQVGPGVRFTAAIGHIALDLEVP